jgi:Protein of unknown function (DUF3455)
MEGFMRVRVHPALIAVFTLAVAPGTTAGAELPDAIAAKGEAVVAQVHAQGAQIYECKAGADGKLAWQFREPIASLFRDGKTVGRHYAGPTWEDADGSAIMAKVAGRAPGATPKDIPLLKLDVTERRGNGALSPVASVQRINTKGGTAEGPCDKPGDLLSVPYSADYVFLRKAP